VLVIPAVPNREDESENPAASGSTNSFVQCRLLDRAEPFGQVFWLRTSSQAAFPPVH